RRFSLKYVTCASLILPITSRAARSFRFVGAGGVGAALEPLFDGVLLFPHAVRNRPANSNAKHVFTAQIIPRPTKGEFPQCNLILLLAQGWQDWLLHADWRMQACTSRAWSNCDRISGGRGTIEALSVRPLERRSVPTVNRGSCWSQVFRDQARRVEN